MGRNCKMSHDVDMIRDGVWVNLSGGKADKIVINLLYCRKATGAHDARTYVLRVNAYDMSGSRAVSCGGVSRVVWSVANRRSALSDDRAVSLARDYVRVLVRDMASLCGADADKAVDDAVAMTDKNW